MRVSRKISHSGIYHIMLRGVNRQQIFFDEEDFSCFTGLLKKYKEVSGFELYAYCIMGNHIHLLLKEGPEKTGQIFRRLGTAFASWYNMKYERVGHVFQGRYRSEIVETQHSLLTVFRYILRNPTAAGLCGLPQEYAYSSAREYFCHHKGISDTRMILDLMDEKPLQEYVLTENDDICMDMETTAHRGVTDEAALNLIIKEFGCRTPVIRR